MLNVERRSDAINAELAEPAGSLGSARSAVSEFNVTVSRWRSSMTLDRREFLAGAGALAVSARSILAAVHATRPATIFPASVRADFPSAALDTYCNTAARHPLGNF